MLVQQQLQSPPDFHKLGKLLSNDRMSVYTSTYVKKRNDGTRGPRRSFKRLINDILKELSKEQIEQIYNMIKQTLSNAGN